VRDRHLAYSGIVLVGGAALVVARVVSRSRYDALAEFWRPYYLPTTDLAKFAGAVADLFQRWILRLGHGHQHLASGPLPADVVLWGVGGAALLGVVHLWRSGRRAHLAAGLSAVLLAIAASAAQRLPLGAARVDLFLLPFGAILVASAAGMLGRLPPAVARWAGVAVLAAAAVQLYTPRAASYPQQVCAPAVEYVAKHWRPGDGIWVNGHASYALAIYGPWPFQFVDARDALIPYPALEIEHFALAGSRQRLPPPVARVFFVYVHHHKRGELEDLLAGVQRMGYETEILRQYPSCKLMVLEREFL
jgi:hypothetical protein